MTSFFCRLIELEATHVIWSVDTLTSQLSSSQLAGGSFLRGSVLSRQYGGCDLGEGFILGVPSYRVTKGAVVTWGFCPEGLMSSSRSGSAHCTTFGHWTGLMISQIWSPQSIISPVTSVAAY